MVVVNANATGSICIWRFNRFRAKLCYRAFYLYAVLGRNIRLPDDRHESCCQSRALYREREITGPRGRRVRVKFQSAKVGLLPSLMFGAVGSFETSLSRHTSGRLSKIHKAARSSTARSGIFGVTLARGRKTSAKRRRKSNFFDGKSNGAVAYLN